MASLGVHMKKLLLSAVAILSFGSFASAADLPAKSAVPAIPGVHCAGAQWHGAYIGIQGGGVNWTANRTDLDGAVNSDLTLVQKKWGGAIGGLIGYNWASCSTLWGIEVDGSWLSTQDTTRLFPFTHTGNIGVESKLNALVTARGRAGLAFDNMLFYFTGGFAAVRSKNTWVHDDPPVFRNVTFDDWNWGWTAGIGTEWAFARNWTLKSEVLYVETRDRTNTAQFFTPPSQPSSFVSSDSLWVTRIGLNYRFGGGW
jgi:outer membrane immunogenic protein